MDGTHPVAAAVIPNAQEFLRLCGRLHDRRITMLRSCICDGRCRHTWQNGKNCTGIQPLAVGKEVDAVIGCPALMQCDPDLSAVAGNKRNLQLHGIPWSNAGLHFLLISQMQRGVFHRQEKCNRTDGQPGRIFQRNRAAAGLL